MMTEEEAIRRLKERGLSGDDEAMLRSMARHPFARVQGFMAEMRENGIHVGVGTPPKCATCDEAWPCSTERGR